MGLYTYRYCSLTEIDKFKGFIDKHWKKGHVLSYNDELIRFQYEVEDEDRLSVVVAENNVTHEFDGIYGYISTYKYDTSHQIPLVLWGAVWKVRKDVDNAEIGKVGINLLKYILKNEEYDAFSVLGISDVNKRIAEALHFTVGELNHYYCASNSIGSYIISKNPVVHKNHEEETHFYVKEILLPGNHMVFEDNQNPYKNITYFRNRYENHKFFFYRFLGLFSSDELRGMFVFRKVQAKGHSVLRIVDFIGSLDGVGSVFNSLQSMLTKEDAEYIDCLNYGLSCDDFIRIGFDLVSPNSDTVIPEYYEPFEQRYVPMEFEYMSDKPIIIFKGDGDQDRPNSIKQ